MSGLLVRQHPKPTAGSAERLILADWAMLREQPDSASALFDLHDGNRAGVAQQELQKFGGTFSADESRRAACFLCLTDGSQCRLGRAIISAFT
jgi:hypothetical protein